MLRIGEILGEKGCRSPMNQSLSLLLSERQWLAKLVRSCSWDLLLEQGREVHAAVLKMGFHFDMIISNCLIDMYAKCGTVEKAQLVFDKMPKRNVVSWTALLCGYLHQGNAGETLSVLCRMNSFSDIRPNDYTFSASLKACGLLGIPEYGMQVHGMCVRVGYEWLPVVGNSIIDMYAKCDRVGDASRMFDAMPVKPLITWNTMIAGYSSEGKFDESVMLFQILQKQGELPDEFTFTSMLKACSSAGAIRQGTQVHAALISRGFLVLSQTVIVGALIDMYVKCGHLNKARNIFDQIKERGFTSWTTLILGYAQEGCLSEAVELFRQLQLTDTQVDSFVLSSLIAVFADLAFVEQGKQLHSYSIKLPSGLHQSVSNSIVDLYLRCGLVEEAERHFAEMPVKNRVSYTVMITGYGKHGLGREALLLFDKMLLENIRPDGVTYLAILSACSHSGLIDECQELFSKLCTDHRIKPRLEHYACMVDLLGRAGRLREAKRLIESMPLKPDSGIWQTLLSACRVHGNLKMGEEIGNILLRIDADSPVGYVTLSNIYANAGRWKECEEVRQAVKKKGLRKEAGQSWVEINKQVHFFYGGDDAHPLTYEIHKLLKELEKRLKEELGYVSEVRYVLHDVEEESKEENLRIHSEKLAIGLALLSSRNCGIEGDKQVIRIFKNLRVCGDCHEFIKGLSKVLGKIFIVRDASRFHKIYNGVCSCKEYW